LGIVREHKRENENFKGRGCGGILLSLEHILENTSYYGYVVLYIKPLNGEAFSSAVALQTLNPTNV
jgi:hypothetical protein